MMMAIFQIGFYLILISYKLFNLKNRLLYIPYYYSLTIFAQFVGAIRQMSGKSKSFWKKAESTR